MLRNLYLVLFISLANAYIFHEASDTSENYRQEIVEYKTYKKLVNQTVQNSKYDFEFSSYYYQPELLESNRSRREVDTTFRGHPKTREEIWHQNFQMDIFMFDQSLSLIKLLMKIIDKYMLRCIPVVIYDLYVENSEGLLLQRLFQKLPVTYMHGKLNEKYELLNPDVLRPKDVRCRSYIMFLADIMMARKILGPQVDNKVVIIPRSTQWKLQEFLSAPESRDIINLLVIGESYSLDKSRERPFILYTHRLYVDGLGSNQPKVLTSWLNGKLSRPHINLFETKLTRGFAGHRFTVAAAHQPPFMFKRLSTNAAGNIQIEWDGLEYRMLKAMSRGMNFSFEIVEPRSPKLGPGDSVAAEIISKRADIGLSGMYVTAERNLDMEMTAAHSLDCAGFITLSSRALPRSRAILGPFRWEVWLCLIIIYLVAIFPLAYSDKLTLKHLWGNFGEVENMFWYVFGTFTNSLTFAGEYSWSNTKKTSTRMLIGWYWVFTIIITACYTGSIIAFVTLPVTPETIDTLDQLRDGLFRIGTYDRGGWEKWFLNSTHKKTARLMKKLEFVASAEEGVNNVTQAWFWPYAFIASKRELQYIIDTNYTNNKIGRRSALHVSEGCFALFSVSMMVPKNSVYRNRMNDAILRNQENGLIGKLLRDVVWETKRIASAGRVEVILQEGKSKRTAVPEERSLNLVDTEGMFMFLGIGYIIALGVLISEWVGGCTNRVIGIIARRKQEREELEEREAHPSRRSSFFPKFSRKTSKASTTSRRSSDRNRITPEPSDNPSSRHSLTSMTGLSKQTLQELYDGPKKNKTAMMFIDGKMVNESEGYEAHREAMREIERLETGSPESCQSGDTHHDGNQISIIAEINRHQCSPPSDLSTSSTTMLPPIEEDAFGDKVLY